MRRLPALFLTVTLALSVLGRPARADLFLSELCDPQLYYTTDRFIEIYNSGPDEVDLTGWSVVAIANAVDVCTWGLSGAMGMGEAFYQMPVSFGTAESGRPADTVWWRPGGHFSKPLFAKNLSLFIERRFESHCSIR